jgi:hypothetical protein
MGFLATYIMRGRWQAATAVSVLAFLSLFMPPISIVSSAALALVTLRRGAYEGLTVFGISLTGMTVLGAILGSVSFTALYGLVLWLPIWIVAILLRAGRKLSLAIESAVLLGGISIVVFYLYNPQAAKMWQEVLTQMAPTNASIETMQPNLDAISHYMTGIVVAGTVFGWIFALFLARWWQATLYNPGGFRAEYLDLATSPRLALGSIALIGIASLSSGIMAEVTWNLSILTFVLYTFVGTAVAHNIMSALKLSRYVIFGFYITLFLIPHLLIPVALVGVSDAWWKLREKMAAKKH